MGAIAEGVAGNTGLRELRLPFRGITCASSPEREMPPDNATSAPCQNQPLKRRNPSACPSLPCFPRSSRSPRSAFAARALGEGLTRNRVLTHLDLSWTDFNSDTAGADPSGHGALLEELCVLSFSGAPSGFFSRVMTSESPNDVSLKTLSIVFPRLVWSGGCSVPWIGPRPVRHDRAEEDNPPRRQCSHQVMTLLSECV